MQLFFFSINNVKLKKTQLTHLLTLLQSQRLSDVGDVIEGLQLRHAGAEHHGEQVNEEVGVLANGQVSFVTHLLEPGGTGGTRFKQLLLLDQYRNRDSVKSDSLRPTLTRVPTA